MQLDSDEGAPNLILARKEEINKRERDGAMEGDGKGGGRGERGGERERKDLERERERRDAGEYLIEPDHL